MAPKELHLAPNRMLRLVKPLYGLTDSGDIWYETLTTFLRDRLTMLPLTGDCSVWSLYQNYGSLRVGHPSSLLTVMAYMIKSSVPNHCSRVLPDA
jgi:hypothetical protein